MVVGSSGLEPPTSRLSGARSNLLSYEPSSRQTPYPPLPPAEKAPSLRCLSSFQPDPLRWALSGGKSGAFSIFFILNGGDKRDRTVDLLLARQALSQLSYTPIVKTSFISLASRQGGKLTHSAVSPLQRKTASLGFSLRF